jgi:aspartate carbamoyltransferase catalytic subunit
MTHAPAQPRPATAAAARGTALGGAWADRDLLGFTGVPAAEIRELLVATREYLPRAGDGLNPAPKELAGKTIATLFFEDSTRTKTSFTLAAQRLGASVADLAIGASSVNKGETVIDTATNVAAMGVMIVRARHAGVAAMVASVVDMPVLNAGDGRHEHPTQALLDAFTIATSFNRLDRFDLAGLRIAIVGDLASSRVCRSNIAALTALGATVIGVGPAALAPHALTTLAQAPGSCTIAHDLDDVLPTIHAVMMLRVQFERHGDAKPAAATPEPPKAGPLASIREYRERFALTTERAARLKPNAIVMHPGPMNRGLEIDSDVADGLPNGPASVILTQVRHGVAARMAALALTIARA